MKVAVAIVLCILGLAFMAGVILHNMSDDDRRNR